MSDHQRDGDKRAELPNISEDHWYAISVSLVIIAVVLACFASGWILSAPSELEMKVRIDIAAPFGGFFLALVTFSTVAWRGMVNSRQADQQKRQNDANDEANYSKLLQEAAKLLADAEKLPQVIAGIASLEILISEPKQRFAVEALDLLGDHLLTTYTGGDFNRVSRAVVRGLFLGEKAGLRSRVDGVFSSTQKHSSRQYLPALRSISLRGGSISAEVYERAKPRIKSLIRVSIHGAEYDSKIQYQDCLFDGCRILKIQEYRVTQHKFRECDFSSAVIQRSEFFGVEEWDLRSDGNYFKEGFPPVDQDGNSLAEKFMTEAEYEQWEGRIPF